MSVTARTSDYRLTVPRLDPSWFFVLYVVAVPLSPELDLYGIHKVRITDILLLPTLIVFLGAAVTASRSHQKTSGLSILYPMLAIVSWDLARLFVLPGSVPLRPSQVDLGLFYLVKRMEYFVVFFLGFAAARAPGRLQTILRRFYLAAPVMNLFVLFQYWQNSGDATPYRASGFVENQPNSTALFIVASLAVGLCLLPAARTQAEKGSLLLSAVTGFAALLATGSREGLLCAILVGLLATWAYRKTRLPACFGLVALGALIWFCGPQSLHERYDYIPDELNITVEGLSGQRNVAEDAGRSSMAARIAVAQHLLEDVLPHSLWTGFGTGYVPLGVIDDFYLTELVYNGLIGLALFGWLLIWLGRMIYQGLKIDPKDGYLQCFSRGMWICFIVLLVDGLAMDVFYVIRPMEAFYIFAGLLAGAIISAREQV